MNPVSEKQVAFIGRLVAERRQTLTNLRPQWLVKPTTSREASKIIDLLMAVPTDPVDMTKVDPDLLADITILRGVVNDLPARDASFAISLIDQFDRKGTLSDRQVPYIKTLLAKATSDAPVGIHREPAVNGNIVSVYIGKNGSKQTAVYDGHGSFNWVRDGIVKFNLSDSTLMTQEDARAFGHANKFCVACLKELSDIRSMASGYGATCASNHGWHYCTTEEAVAILGLPVAD